MLKRFFNKVQETLKNVLTKFSEAICAFWKKIKECFEKNEEALQKAYFLLFTLLLGWFLLFLYSDMLLRALEKNSPLRMSFAIGGFIFVILWLYWMFYYIPLRVEFRKLNYLLDDLKWRVNRLEGPTNLDDLKWRYNRAESSVTKLELRLLSIELTLLRGDLKRQLREIEYKIDNIREEK